jgi:hypothetical protein
MELENDKIEKKKITREDYILLKRCAVLINEIDNRIFRFKFNLETYRKKKLNDSELLQLKEFANHTEDLYKEIAKLFDILKD